MTRPVPLRSRLVAMSIAAALVVAAATITGCHRDTARPDPQPNYLAVGPKENFPEYLRGTILEHVDIAGTEPLVISGYGIVANLDNTGRADGIPTVVRDHVAQTARFRGVGSMHTEGGMASLSVSEFFADPRTTIVRVDGIVPPGARREQRIDLVVTTLPNNTTTSLARGVLYQTELHKGHVSAQSPGERVNKVGVGRGYLVVNPVHALMGPEAVRNDQGAQASLRTAIIPDGGVYQEDRVFLLKLRQPSRRTARAIEHRINYAFGASLAAAQDEGIVQLRMPDRYRGDWERFIAVATCIYFHTGHKEGAIDQAGRLAEVAMAPSATTDDLMLISHAWEGMGPVVAPVLVPLMGDPNPGVAYAAARAAAFVGEPGALDALLGIARDPSNPFALAAAESMGKLPSTPATVRRVRELLSVEDPAIRIAAYESLWALRDRSIFERRIGDNFLLHIVGDPSQRTTPIVYASRTGTPRIAIIGGRPQLKAPMVLAAYDDRLTISINRAGDPAHVFYRPVGAGQPLQTRSLPDLVELVARLGGEAVPGDRPLSFRYSDVVAIVKKLGDEGLLLADGRRVGVTLQDLSVDLAQDAPTIPGLENFDRLRLEEEPQAAAAPTPAATSR